MKKVNILGFVGVDELVLKLSNEVEFLNNGFEYSDVKEFILNNGSGVYELMFGCRGGLEELIKNDEYLKFHYEMNKLISGTNKKVLVNDLPSFYLYSDLKSVYYWCGDDILYLKKENILRKKFKNLIFPNIFIC